MREWRDIYHQLKEVFGELPVVRERAREVRRGGTEVRGRRGGASGMKQSPGSTGATHLAQDRRPGGGARPPTAGLGENA